MRYKIIGILIVCLLIFSSVIPSISVYNIIKKNDKISFIDYIYYWNNKYNQSDPIGQGNIYYVSELGDDNNLGNFNSPWRTIQKACDVVNPGDTVYVRRGTYNDLVVMTRSGSSSQWIKFKNYADELPIVDGTGVNPIYWAGGIIQVNDASYILIDGFKVQNSIASGICILRSNFVTVQNCQTTNTGKSGIRVCYGEGTDNKKQCTNINVLNNTIALSNTGNDQEALTFSGVDNSKIKYNILTSTCKKEGICCKHNCNNCTISNNNLATPGVNIYIGGTDGGYSSNFWVHENYCHGKKSSISISLEKCGQSENFYIYNNIFASDVYGFNLIDEMIEGDCSTGPRNVYFINNVLNAGNTAFKINPNTTETYMRNVIIRNNILKGSIYSIYISDDKQPINQLTIDHNFFLGTPFPSDIVYGTYYLTDDPKWINPFIDDYHLQLTSPAIDAGSSKNAPTEDYDGNSRPQGTAVDIGAYEYVNNIPSTPTIPDGPSSGYIRNPYIYTTSSIDPEDDNIRYGWDWDGDDIVDEWTRYFPSGAVVNISHIWKTKGNFNIKVKAMDINGAQSDFSSIKEVVIDVKVKDYYDVVNLWYNSFNKNICKNNNFYYYLETFPVPPQ